MNNKVAIVTGSSRGIGRATAIELANNGFAVIVNYLTSKSAAEEVVSEIKKIGHSDAIAIQADVTDIEQVQCMYKLAVEAFGQIDVLINNAGHIFRPGHWRQLDTDGWQRTIDVNLMGAVNCVKAIADHMLNRHSGKIINVASTVGITGVSPVLAYSMAKAGILILTRALAKELAPNIQVNAVAPGNIATEMTLGAGEKFIETVINATPLKRLGTPEDVANTIAFLASSKADFITGQVIIVDGGITLK